MAAATTDVLCMVVLGQFVTVFLFLVTWMLRSFTYGFFWVTSLVWLLFNLRFG